MRLARAELGAGAGFIDAVDLAAWVVVLALTPVIAVASAAVTQAWGRGGVAWAFVGAAVCWPFVGRACRVELRWAPDRIALTRRLGPVRWWSRTVERSAWSVGIHAARGVTALVVFGTQWTGAPLTVITSSFHRLGEGDVRRWAAAAQPLAPPQEAGQQVAASQRIP